MAWRYGADHLVNEHRCAQNHHVCSQMRSCTPHCVAWPPIILKLERQAEWFNFFVEHAGINRTGLFGDAWLPISGKPGFYFPPGAEGTTTGNVHPTNATGRLAEFYTERTAHLVAEAYIHDFRYFDYCKGYHCLVEGDLD